jgi:hypothetical protein
MGLNPDFWGDGRGGVLKGILKNKPLYFSGLKEEDEYRDFKNLSEIKICQSIINRLISLDRLLESISSINPLDKDMFKDPLLTFHPLLFNLWAGKQLNLKPGFSLLSLEQVKDFFRLLRQEEQGPPYEMKDFMSIFIQDLISYDTKATPEDITLLKDSLSQLWHEFSEEYARLDISDLDARYTKFFMIVSNPDT